MAGPGVSAVAPVPGKLGKFVPGEFVVDAVGITTVSGVSDEGGAVSA